MCSNLIVPVDGLGPDKRPAVGAEKAWRVSDPIYFTEWPRQTLHRFMHGAIATAFVQHTEAHWKAIQEGFKQAEPPTAKACLDALRRLFREGYDTYAFKERAFVYGTETVAGTDDTLAALVDEMVHFEVPKKDAGLNHYTRAHLAETTYFLMLRASKAAVKEARAGIAKAAAFSGPKKNYEEYFEALDFVANGSAGVKRHMGKWISMEVPALSMGAGLEYAADDPDYVRDNAQRRPEKKVAQRACASGGSAAPPRSKGSTAASGPPCSSRASSATSACSATPMW